VTPATIVRLPDRDACRRLSDLVAQLDGLARLLAAGEDVTERLVALQERAAQLADDVQARLPWVVRHDRPAPVTGKWGGRTRARAFLARAR
jgi:hypothetical protein